MNLGLTASARNRLCRCMLMECFKFFDWIELWWNSTRRAQTLDWNTLFIWLFTFCKTGFGRRLPILIVSSINTPWVFPRHLSAICNWCFHWWPETTFVALVVWLIIGFKTVIKYDVGVSAGSIWDVIEGGCILPWRDFCTRCISMLIENWSALASCISSYFIQASISEDCIAIPPRSITMIRYPLRIIRSVYRMNLILCIVHIFT